MDEFTDIQHARFDSRFKESVLIMNLCNELFVFAKPNTTLTAFTAFEHFIAHTPLF